MAGTSWGSHKQPFYGHDRPGVIWETDCRGVCWKHSLLPFQQFVLESTSRKYFDNAIFVSYLYLNCIIIFFLSFCHLSFGTMISTLYFLTSRILSDVEILLMAVIVLLKAMVGKRTDKWNVFIIVRFCAVCFRQKGNSPGTGNYLKALNLNFTFCFLFQNN